MRMRARFLLAALTLMPWAAQAGETPAPENAYLYIGWPNDGEVLRTGGGQARSASGSVCATWVWHRPMSTCPTPVIIIFW